MPYPCAAVHIQLKNSLYLTRKDVSAPMISAWIDIARNAICEFVLKYIVLFIVKNRLKLKGYLIKSTHVICTNNYVMLRIDFADGITELPLSLKGWSEFRYDKGIHLCWWLKEDAEKRIHSKKHSMILSGMHWSPCSVMLTNSRRKTASHTAYSWRDPKGRPRWCKC